MPRAAIFITTILLFSGIFVVGDEHTAYAASCIQLGYQGKHTLLDNISLFLTNESCSTSGDYSIESFKLYQKAPSFDAVQNDLGANVLRPESYNIVNVAPKKVDIQLGLFGVPIAFPEPPWVGKGTYAGHIVSADNFVGDDTVAEDAIIEAIQKKGTFTISGTNMGSIEVPATNCVKLSGDGPIKVVFMRSDRGTSNLDAYLSNTKVIIDEGFKKIDPFATYVGKFSFYIDLHKLKEANLPHLNKMNDPSSDTVIRSSSSCGADAYAYVFFFSDPELHRAWIVPQFFEGKNVAYINMNKNFTDISTGVKKINYNVAYPYLAPETIIHEMAHILGDLNDEYSKAEWSILGFLVERRNCALRPSGAFRYQNIYYGSPASSATKGCYVDTLVYPLPVYPHVATMPVYRPSVQSIMRDEAGLAKFNVISCGYVLTGIFGQSPNQENAQKYWPDYWTDAQGKKQPGCGPTFVNNKPTQGPMNTVIDGIPDMSDPPTVNRITPSN